MEFSPAFLLITILLFLGVLVIMDFIAVVVFLLGLGIFRLWRKVRRTRP